MMHWLRRLLKPSWRELNKRAVSYGEAGKLSASLHSFEKALRCFDGSPKEHTLLVAEKYQLQDRIRRLKLSFARSLGESGDVHRAQQVLEEAHELTHDATSRDEVNELWKTLIQETWLPSSEITEPFVVLEILTNPVEGDLLVGYLHSGGIPARRQGGDAAMIGVGQHIMEQRIEVPRSRLNEAIRAVHHLRFGVAAEGGELAIVGEEGEEGGGGSLSEISRVEREGFRIATS